MYLRKIILRKKSINFFFKKYSILKQKKKVKKILNI